MLCYNITKLIFLQDEIEKKQQGRSQYDLSSIHSSWFKHDEKINRALNKLGDDCRILREAPFDSTLFGISSHLHPAIKT